MTISVVVTNWNGLKLLQKNFEQVIINSKLAQEIIFCDDASSDNSVNFVSEYQKKYPFIKIITHKTNVGFGENSNNAVNKCKSELVVLLNNDISTSPNYIYPALKHFQDTNVFGVGLCEINRKNWAKFFWKDGYLQYQPGQSTNKTHISGWLSGGSSIVRKDYFLKLKGFDPIYSPFYSEDLDLGYRAWKSGYQILWEPKCEIVHNHEATISKFPKRFLDYVKERNRLLTVWRNITDPKLIKLNRLAMVNRILFGPNYIKIILAANRQINHYPPAIVFPKRSDSEIFKLFS